MDFLTLPFLLTFALGFVLGAFVLLWPLLSSRKHVRFLEGNIGQYFKSLSQDVLNNSNDQFLKLAGEKFKQWQIEEQAGHEKRQATLQEMVKPVSRQLEVLQEQVTGLNSVGGKLADDLKHLNKETNKLVSVLKNPRASGVMGEDLLERLLEFSGLQRNVHYWVQETQSDKKRPDVTIDLGGQLRLFIDAKTPLIDVLDDITAENEQAIAATVKARVKEHVKELSKKAYWKEHDGPDFVVLFLPTDTLYAMATRIEKDGATLLDLAAENRVILSSPMLLLGFLRSLAFLQRQVEATRNAQDLLKLSADLHFALQAMLGEFGRVGKNLDTTTRAYNESLRALETKVMPLVGKIEDMQGIATDDKLELPVEAKVLAKIIHLKDSA